MVVLAVKYEVMAGQEDRVAESLTAMAHLVREHEPGCLFYRVHRAMDDPTHFMLYEGYRDEESLKAHRATAHFHSLIEEKVMPVLRVREPVFYRLIAAAEEMERPS